MRVILASLLGSSLLACERVVNITVPYDEELLVVEGRVEAVQGRTTSRQVIVLTTTAPYFPKSAAQPARDAQVSIVDDAGRVTVLRESATAHGQYVTDSLVAVVGTRYTLRLRWRGDDYEAVDSLLPVAPIDSLYFDLRTAGGVGPESNTTTGLRATIDAQDPPGVANYYLWDMIVDGVRVNASDSTARFRAIDSDQFNDGRPARGMQPHIDTPVRPGQLVMVRQHSLTEQIYRYYKALNDQVSGDGSPFSVPPNSLRGNVANLSRPAARALGYFMATNVSERERIVP